MVQALILGRKSQTRRPVGVFVPPVPLDWLELVNALGDVSHRKPAGDPMVAEWEGRGYKTRTVLEGLLEKCPFGKVGDRLWVREKWDYADCSTRAHEVIAFQAGFSHVNTDNTWRSPIYLARRHSRILLEITGIRVEKLWDITEEDAVKEGVTEKAHHIGTQFAYAVNQGRTGWYTDGGCLRGGYGKLWDSLHKKGPTWHQNPWVWVVDFHILEAPVIYPEPLPEKLDLLRRVFAAMTEHPCTVTGVLGEPEPMNIEGPHDFHRIRVAYSSPDLGDGETNLVCLSRDAALEVQVGHKFTRNPPEARGIVAN